MRFLLLAALSLQAGDLLLRNGRVWTGDSERPWADSIVVKGNRIEQVGRNLKAPGARVIDLRGRLAIPGFHDAHMHFLGGSLGLSQIDLNGICTLETMQRAVAQFATEHPGDSWLHGRGWEYVCLPQGRLPRKEDLDSVVAGRPVFLSAYDGHTAWVNSKALALAGIDRNTVYKGYGEIVRDAQGEPTGALTEGAMGLVRRLLPAPSKEQKLAAMETGMKRLAELGVTSVQNANGNLDELELYDTLLAAGKMTLRASLAMSVGPMVDVPSLQEYAALRQKYAGPALRVGAIKIMLDGVIESYTAAMLEPYTNKPSTSGKPAWTQEQFNTAVARADELGLQVYTHAIGDRAVRMALDGFEHARRVNGARDARHRIEHIETIHPSDLPRFAALGVLPSMQPIHADPGTIEVWSAAIGPERSRLGFAWNSIAKAGGRLVFSSDWPASISVDPIRGLHNAVNRRTISGLPSGGWIPEERVSVQTALRAYTSNAAYAGHQDTYTGTIKPGMLADIAVLSADPFRGTLIDIHKTRADITIYDGRVVHERR
ncbi:MAG: amidohydrolase [Acidobacteria bacterium]|nr:amidohydrolase [Acidobacteriota bacterium]